MSKRSRSRKGARRVRRSGWKRSNRTGVDLGLYHARCAGRAVATSFVVRESHFGNLSLIATMTRSRQHAPSTLRSKPARGDLTIEVDDKDWVGRAVEFQVKAGETTKVRVASSRGVEAFRATSAPRPSQRHGATLGSSALSPAGPCVVGASSSRPLTRSSPVALVTRKIGLSLGADIDWPKAYEDILARLDLTLPIGRDKVRFHVERTSIEPYELPAAGELRPRHRPADALVPVPARVDQEDGPPRRHVRVQQPLVGAVDGEAHDLLRDDGARASRCRGRR